MITPSDIIRTAADHFHQQLDKVLSTNRKRELVTVRQVSMYFIRIYIKGISLENVGRYFPGRKGYKDHATILHACKTVNNLLDTDKEFKSDIDKLNRKMIELFDLGISFTPEETEEERFEKLWSERERVLISENKHLKQEVIYLKNEVSKLQGRIFGLKLNRAKKRTSTIKLPIHGDPYKELQPANNREYHGYREHQL